MKVSRVEKKSIVFVILAFVVAAFYALEIILSVVQRSTGGPTVVKALLAVACMYYGVAKVKNRHDSKA